jgi:hypothetical protein
MVTQTISAISEAVSQLTNLMASVANDKVNTVPYDGSWTAPQLLRHVTKSISGMAQTMLMEGKPTDRDPGERIDELKTLFLDFSKKMNSPEFILPEDGPYEKQTAIDGLNTAFRQLEENAQKTTFNQVIEGLPFGPITKLELIHFTLFHTQRHLEQMRRICEALKNK